MAHKQVLFRSAACEKLRRSTTAQNAASWRVSISEAYPCDSVGSRCARLDRHLELAAGAPIVTVNSQYLACAFVGTVRAIWSSRLGKACEQSLLSLRSVGPCEGDYVLVQQNDKCACH